jgi:Ni/Co efflux regulator RcnB
MKLAIALSCACLLIATPSLAEKPANAGNSGKQVEKDVGNKGGPNNKNDGPQGKNDKNDKNDKHDNKISTNDRDEIRRYYGDQFRAGNCPPGLAKKNNGCMPPGQAKKWSIGQRLPRDLAYHDLPRDLYSRLRPPGDGYKYVRADADILMISTGTMMVIDAIQDLNQGGRGS